MSSIRKASVKKDGYGDILVRGDLGSVAKMSENLEQSSVFGDSSRKARDSPHKKVDFQLSQKSEGVEKSKSKKSARSHGKTSDPHLGEGIRKEVKNQVKRYMAKGSSAQQKQPIRMPRAGDTEDAKSLKDFVKMNPYTLSFNKRKEISEEVLSQQISDVGSLATLGEWVNMVCSLGLAGEVMDHVRANIQPVDTQLVKGGSKFSRLPLDIQHQFSDDKFGRGGRVDAPHILCELQLAKVKIYGSH